MKQYCAFWSHISTYGFILCNIKHMSTNKMILGNKDLIVTYLTILQITNWYAYIAQYESYLNLCNNIEHHETIFGLIKEYCTLLSANIWRYIGRTNIQILMVSLYYNPGQKNKVKNKFKKSSEIGQD